VKTIKENCWHRGRLMEEATKTMTANTGRWSDDVGCKDSVSTCSQDSGNAMNSASGEIDSLTDPTDEGPEE
jgi:hypothetical protein